MGTPTPKYDHTSNKFLSLEEQESINACYAHPQRICRSPAEVAKLLLEYAQEERNTVTWLQRQAQHYEDRYMTNKDGTKTPTQLLVQGPNLAMIASYEAHIQQLFRRADQINPIA